MKKGFGLLRQVNGPVESGVQTSAPKRRWPRRKVRRASVCPGLSRCSPFRPVDGPGFRSFRRWNRAERGDGVRIDPIGRKRATSRTAPRCPRTASFISSGVQRMGCCEAPWTTREAAGALVRRPLRTGCLVDVAAAFFAELARDRDTDRQCAPRLACPVLRAPFGAAEAERDAIAVSRTGHELRACPAGDAAPSIRVSRARRGRRILSGVSVPRSARLDGTGAIRPALRYDAFRPRGLGLFFPRGS